MKRKLLSRGQAERLFYNLLTVCIAVLFLFPLYWIFASSLKAEVDIFKYPPSLIPGSIHFENYVQLLNMGNGLYNSFKNSFIIAISVMIFAILLAVPASYSLARFRLPGQKFILITFLITQMLPASLVLTPLFITFSNLGLLNTYLSPILACVTISIPFTVVVLRPIFMSFPKELDEAARIDGCNRFTSFVRVALPVSVPGLITVGCFSFMHGWNDLIYSMTFNTKDALRPMTTTIYHLISDLGMRWNLIMGYGVCLVLPAVIIFVVAQKYIIGGMVSGSVKG